MLLDQLRQQYDPDRQKSLLTTAQRNYLLNNKEISSADYERGIRQDIRERVLSGLFDFGILTHQLGDRDIEQIFDLRRGTKFKETDGIPEYYKLFHQNYRATRRRDPDGTLQSGKEHRVAITAFEEIIIDVIAFLCRGFHLSSHPMDIEDVFERGVTRGLAQYDKTADVTIETTSVNRDVLLKKLEGGELNPEELRILHQLERDIDPVAPYGEQDESMCPSCRRPKSELQEVEKSIEDPNNEVSRFEGLRCKCGWWGKESDLTPPLSGSKEATPQSLKPTEDDVPEWMIKRRKESASESGGTTE